jgi:TRAP-type C4-dicarboxylate transport system permease small subunit
MTCAPLPTRAPRLVRLLARLGHAVAVAEGAGIGAALCALIGLACWQFGCRMLRGYGVAPAPLWVSSVIRHAVFFIGFLGAAFATHTLKHLRVDAITRLLEPRKRLALRVVTTAFALAVCLMLARAGWRFRADLASNEEFDLSQQSELITAPRGALAMPVGFGLISLHFLLQIVFDVTWLASRETPPASWLAEARGE